MRLLLFPLLLSALFFVSCSSSQKKTHGPVQSPTIPLPAKSKEVNLGEVDRPLAVVKERNNQLQKEVVSQKVKAKNLTKQIGGLQKMAGENEELKKAITEAEAGSKDLENDLLVAEGLLVEQSGELQEVKDALDESKARVLLVEAENVALRSNQTELNSRVSLLVQETIPKIEGERDAAFDKARDSKSELERVKRWRARLMWIVAAESLMLIGIAYLFFSSSGLSLIRPFLRG